MAFLACFPGNHVYCTLDDSQTEHKLIHYHEGFDLTREQILAKLRKENEGTRGIFFCVNEIDRSKDPGKHRTARMLSRIRAVWADDDNIRDEPRSDFPISPNVVVETSRGKFHYYWLTTTDNIEEWGGVMNGIANKFNTDGNSKDLVRVLRLPGFFHKKKEPFQSLYAIMNPKPYSWNEIVQAFPPDANTKPRSVAPTGRVNAQFTSFVEARHAIADGSNYHGAIMWLLNHWANSGIKSPDELLYMISDVLSQATVQDERWSARTNHEYLQANVRDALAFVEANPIHSTIEVPTITKKEHQLQTGWPPGLMGDLCNEILEMAPHPNEEVALMAGFSLVAGICGRSFNVLGTGLNLYVALLADSGIGKANLKNSINTALLKLCALEGGGTFKGASRFTGPKPLFEMLMSGLSRVCILEESGLMSESTAGDQKGLTRVMLDIFSSSGYGEYAGGESYSKAENSIPVIPSPALTIAHVSTPLSYLRALKSRDASMTGDVARVWMMRSMRDKQRLNQERRSEFSNAVTTRIKDLVKSCVPHQVKERSIPTDLITNGIDIQSESDEWTKKENEYKHFDDQLRRALASRAFIKILKIAAVSSVFNGLEEVGVKEYRWAKKAIQGEITVLEDAVSYGTSDDMMMIVKGIIVPVISKILNDDYNDTRKCPPKTLLGKGIFTGTNLSQCLRNNEVLKRMNDDPERPNPRSGVEKMLAFLIRTGLISIVPAEHLQMMGAKTRVAYKITDDFLLLMEG
ncbi:MAG: DNA-primase RepB domain-containing protein [Candidatus Thorarchaeota archaeon]